MLRKTQSNQSFIIYFIAITDLRFLFINALLLCMLLNCVIKVIWPLRGRDSNSGKAYFIVVSKSMALFEHILL